MNPVTLLAVGALVLLMLKKSGGTTTTPEGGTPEGTIPSSVRPRRAYPALPNDPTEEQKRAYVDAYNRVALYNGEPTKTYQDLFGSADAAESSNDWYQNAVNTAGGLIKEGEAAITDFGSSMYNWATGANKAVAR